MKRKFIAFVGGVAIVSGVAINLSLSSNNGSFSNLALANIEALARGEGDGTTCDSLCTKDDSKDCTMYGPGSASCTYTHHRSIYSK